MTKVLVNKKNVTMEYDESKKIVYLIWKGFQTEEGIYEAGNEILKQFKKLDTGLILNDNTEVKGPWNKAAKWTQEEWFPAMLAAGLKKFAWVFPDNLFAELSASQAMPDNDLITKHKSRDTAENWLLN